MPFLTGMDDVLGRLGRAALEHFRDARGITEAEQKAQEATDAAMLRRIQAQEILQRLKLAPAEQESQIAARSAGTELARAQAEAARALATQRGIEKPQKAVERAVDLGNQIEYIYTDGTREMKPKGPAPRAGGDGTTEVFAANPFQVTDAQGNTRMAVRVKGGGYQFVDSIGGQAVHPGPTAEQRNVEYQAQAVEPALNLVESSLNEFEKSIEGGLPGGPSAMIPGTAAYYSKTKFQEQAKALLGAIVARQAGEGSRLSDEDRRAYSQAATLVNNLITLPGGVEAARARLAEAKTLLGDIMARRRGGGVVAPGGGAGFDPSNDYGYPVGTVIRGPQGRMKLTTSGWQAVQ